MAATSTPAPRLGPARAGAVLCGAALLAGALAGCGHASTDAAGTPGSPPVLHIATGTDALGRDAMPAGAAGGGWGGWVLGGPLPDEPRSAPVYGWSATAADAAAVTKLAAALGIDGTPARHSAGWVERTAAGELRVADAGGHPWSYARADRLDCPPYWVDVEGTPGAATTSCAVASPAGQLAVRGPDAPAARAAAAAMLAAAGVASVDAAAAAVSVGSPTSTLSVAPTVDGMPTQGLDTSAEVDLTGVAAAGGRLDLPAAGAPYALRTARAAFAALADGPRPLVPELCGPVPVDGGTLPPVPGAGGSGAPEPAPVPSSKAAAARSGAPSAPCPTPSPQRVTGAVLGLLLAYDATADAVGPGRDVAVPAWFFQVQGSQASAAIIAVDPALLAPPPEPATSGGAAPGSPGSSVVPPGDVTVGGSSAGSPGAPVPEATK